MVLPAPQVEEANIAVTIIVIKDSFKLWNHTMTDSTKVSLGQLTTEARNPLTQNLDNLSALELVKVMNAEDEKVAAAVRKVSEPVAKAIDVIADRLSGGGRLIYVGAGTSGRLGVLDAVECPPTFNTDPEMVIGLIAGGPKGLLQAVEGAEDSEEMGRRDLQLLELSDLDVVVGIAASGRTPYVIGALDYARETDAFAIAFSCNEDAEIGGHAGDAGSLQATRALQLRRRANPGRRPYRRESREERAGRSGPGGGSLERPPSPPVR